MKFQKGEVILHQDDVPRCIYAVKKGVILVSNLTSHGDYRAISFELVDGIVPIGWIFSKTTKSLFYYSAHTDCELYAIDKASFLTQLVDNHAFTKSILNRMASSLVGARLRVDALEKPTARSKLLYMFRYMCLRYGTDIGKDTVRIEVPLTQQDVANYAGLTRETTSVELHKLKAEKVIRYEHMWYVVNTDKLNNVIEDEFNPGISIDTVSKLSEVL